MITPFYRTVEFWTAVLTPILAAVWPAVVLKLPFLSSLTAEQLTAVIAGGIVALITGVGLFTYGRLERGKAAGTLR